MIEVRRAVAENRNTPTDVLEALSYHWSFMVREAVVRTDPHQ